MGTYDLFRTIAKSDLTSKERTIEQMQYDILADFYDSPSYQSVTINNTSRDVQILDENAITKNPNKKRILCKPDEDINIGDDIVWNSEHWLCTNVDSDKTVYAKGIIERCNNTLKFYKNKVLYSLPCIFTDISIDMEESKFMNLPIGHYLIYISAGTIIKSDINLRFILNDAAYKIEGISNATNGIVKIELVDDEITPDDNLTLGIANYFNNQLIEIPSTDETYVTLTPYDNTLILGRTLELTAHTFTNNVEDLTKFYLFTVTNDDGTTNEYVESSSLANVCTLVANKTPDCAGKIINVHVNHLGVSSIYYDRKIKLIAF